MIKDAVRSLSRTEELARGGSIIHSLNPAVKLIAFLCYIIALISVGRLEPVALAPFAAFPVLVWILSELPIKPLLRQITIVFPFLLLMGIFNPLFSREPVPGHVLTSGWLTCVTLVCKGLLAVTAMLLYIGTTGIDGFSRALRSFRVPRLFVLQLMLTYRYLSLLAGETGRVTLAYSVRAPRDRGVRFSAWGSLAGHMLLRSYDRACRVYDAMLTRGFDGEYRSGAVQRTRARDIVFLCVTAAYGIIVRLTDIPGLLGGIFV